MAEVRIRIDGRDLMADGAHTILDAARAADLGERIPTLCHLQGMAPQGGCRLCVVAVQGETQPVAACLAPVRDGMVVETRTPRIDGLRRDILRLLAAANPGAAEASNSFVGGRDARVFHALLHQFGVSAPPGADRGITQKFPPQTHPYLRFDPGACISCRRCVQICEDLQGQFVFAVGGRGSSVRLIFGTDEQFSNSPCVSCGACVEVCPTGALFDRDRAAGPPDEELRLTRSVCGYCGVGCGVEVMSTATHVVRISGAPASPVNRGHLCAKGRYAHGWSRSPERLTQPLLREGSGFRPISWHEALEWAAARLTGIVREHGADSVGVLTSSRSTNEAAYLLQKVFRAILGTNNVDCCARVCHSSTALALSLATGTGAASASYEDIEKAQVIVVAGANPTEAHPIIGARIKQAVRRGARLVVIDPRAIELTDYATLHLQIEPGTNVALFNALARIALDEALYDQKYVTQRTEGFDDLRRFCAGISLPDAATVCGVPLEQVFEAARLIAGHGPVLFVTGLGLSELTQGTDSVLALTNLGLLTGSIGASGGGMLPLRGQNNVQGNADMGSTPNLVTGYQPLADPEVRNRLKEIWGDAPPEAPGMTIPEMLEAARAERLHGLWIQGEDVLQSEPNEAAVREAIASLELLVVQELFMSETAHHAHLVLPAAGVLEQDGTFTNGERRIQRVRRAVPPPGSARPDWEVARDLGRALGVAWNYEHPSQVMDEIAQVAPALFGGVRYERLAEAGLQWPCPAVGHAGTATVHAERFMRGRGRLFPVSYNATPEVRTPQLPYLLITGRVLQHYNVGTMTRRTPNLGLVAQDVLLMHRDDANADGLVEGEDVVVESRYGSIVVTLQFAAEIRRGTVFLSFHFPDTHANALTSSLVDPQSKCPEYKVTAVAVRSVGSSRAPPSETDDAHASRMTG